VLALVVVDEADDDVDVLDDEVDDAAMSTISESSKPDYMSCLPEVVLQIPLPVCAEAG